MGFGIDTTGNISRNTNYSVNVGEKIGEDGTITDMTAYGGAEETTLESYVDAASFANEATNQQAGSTIITAHSLIESNTEYARQSKTTRVALPATTTTT